MLHSLRHSLPLLLLLILFFTGSRTATAGVDRWTPLGPDGGIILALAADPEASGTLYAGTQGSGVWRSTDGGVRWRSSSDGLGPLSVGGGLGPPDVYALAVSPGAPGTVWAATGGGIFKSTDAGATWTRVWSEEERPGDTYTAWSLSVAVDPADPDVAWAGTVRGWVLKTTDGGATWSRKLDLGNLAGVLRVDPEDTNTVYANGGNGLFKTTDGGATWTRIREGAGALALDPANPRILYSGGPGAGLHKSTDGGATWSPLPGLGEEVVQALLIDPSDSSVLLAASLDELWRSEDAGATWHQVSLPGSLRVLALEADPLRAGRTWLGTSDHGVFRSLNAGRTWRASREDLSATRPLGMAFDPFRPRTLYLADPSTGAHRSTDGGRTWSRINAGLRWPASTPSANQVAAHPSRPGVLFAGTGAGAYRSLDRGNHWSYVSSPHPGEIQSFAFDPRRPDTIFAGGESLLRSRDGGRTWKRLELPETSYESKVAKLVLSPLRPQTLFALDFNSRFYEPTSLFRSPDSGNTWQLVFSRNAVALAPHPTLPGVLYLAGAYRGEIWRSDDDGLTWEKVAEGVGGGADLTELLVDRRDPSILYLGTYGAGVWWSRDSGVTWEPLAAEMIAPRITCLEADPRKPRHLVACTWGGGLLEIQVSSAP